MRLQNSRRAAIAKEAHPALLALLPDLAARQTLRAALLADFGATIRAQIGFCESTSELLQRLNCFLPALVIADLEAADANVLKMVRARLPQGGLVAWLQQKGNAIAVRDLVTVGVDAIVLGDETRDAAAVERQVMTARAAGLVRRVKPDLQRLTPPDLVEFMDALLRQPMRPVTVEKTAALFCCASETLRKRLLKSGFPPPAKLVAWFRLFHAGSLLENPRRSVENVAIVLDFPSRTALQNQLRRYSGQTPLGLRRQGALQTLLAQFKSRHEEGMWDILDQEGDGNKDVPESDKTEPLRNHPASQSW